IPRPARRSMSAIRRTTRPRRSSPRTTDPTRPPTSAPTLPICRRGAPCTARRRAPPKLAQRPASAPIQDRNTSGRSLSPADRNRNPLLRIPFPDNRHVRQRAVGVSATKQTVLLLRVFLVGQNSFVAKFGELAQLGGHPGNDGPGLAPRLIVGITLFRSIIGGGRFLGAGRRARAFGGLAAATGAGADRPGHGAAGHSRQRHLAQGASGSA